MSSRSSVTVSERASSGRRRSWGPLAVAYVVYVPLAISITIMTRFCLSTDGVAYMRISKYYAEGNTDLAVTGYWAPLLSWLIAPAHWVGCDAVLAGHVVSAAAGLLLIAGVWRLTRLFRISGVIAQVLPTAAGLLALSWLGWSVLADPLAAALITWYVAHNYILCRTLRVRHAAVAGAVAGVAYLAKYYALPFFMLHHAVSVFLIAKRRHRWAPGRRHITCYVTGMLTCAAVAAPWITVLSIKYGKPTFATTGRVVHGYVAPEVPEGRYYPLNRLANPRPGRVTVWENPDEIEFDWPQWSPTASVREMVHQLRLFFRNGRAMAKCFFEADNLGLIYTCLLLSPVMALLPRRNTLRVDRWLWRWALLVVVTYLSGLLFVFAEAARYYWALQGMLLTLVGLLATIASRRLPSTRNTYGRQPPRWGVVFAVVILATCLAQNAESVRRAVLHPNADLVEVAEALRAHDVSGPLVANHWNCALQIAYRLETPLCGVPSAKTVVELKQQLRQVDAENLLVFHNNHKPAAAAHVEYLANELARPSITVRRGQFEVSVYSVRRLLNAKKTLGATSKFSAERKLESACSGGAHKR